jgi:hypothetical protein
VLDHEWIVGDTAPAVVSIVAFIFFKAESILGPFYTLDNIIAMISAWCVCGGGGGGGGGYSCD